MESKCDAGYSKSPQEIGLNLPHQIFAVFAYIANIRQKIAKDGNASRPGMQRGGTLSHTFA